MIGRAWSLALSLLVLNLAESIAYHQPGQSGLSATTQAQEQVACPSHFRGLKPYEHDCHRFINCAEGRPVIQTCGPGTAFNAVIQTCDHQSQVSCEGQPGRSARLLERPLEPRCEPGFSGLQPHPSDCTKFLNCANGQTFIQSCGPGTAFSPTQLVCDYKHKVNCGAASGQGEVKGTSVSLECPAGARGPVPYPNDQSKYIICETGVHPRLEQCLPGWVFNTHSLTCSVSGASSASADYSSAARFSGLLCPGGVDGLFVHPFDQTKFLNCKAGKIAVQSCSPGQVFSISKGYCQPKTQLLYTDYVAYFVSQISIEYSLMLTSCPAGTDGVHLYPYDAGKYIRCTAGELSIISCGEDLAYSFIKSACRPSRQVTRSERVKFFSELSFQGGSYSYTDSQAFQSALKSCPADLRGNYAYPFHAGHYVLCQNGLLQVVSCPAGSVYSLSTKRCSARQQLSPHDFLDYAYINVQLSTNFMQDLTTVTCPANAQGYYLHPFDCTKYISCRDQQTSIESCKRGEVFSISRRLCVARDQLVAPYDRVEYLTDTQHEFNQENLAHQGRELQTNAQPTNDNEEVVCPAGASGVQPHPYDCTKFLNCGNGQTFIQDCGPGTAFSPSLLVCDFKDKVDCGQGYLYTGQSRKNYGGGVTGAFEGHQGGSSTGVSSESTSRSSTGLSCPVGARGNVFYPHDPSKYILCGIGVEPRLEQCPHGEIFDRHSLICTPTGSSSAHTDFTSAARLRDLLCPGGVEGLFAHPFDQTKFLNCKAGKIAVQSCILSNVFSISKGYCQPKTQLVYTDYVAYIVSQISNEYSLMLTRCPEGTDGLHLYPYDAGKYVRCAAGGELSILNCGESMAYSFVQRACRPKGQVTLAERVKFFSEQSLQEGSYSYTDSQAFQSALKSCPVNLRGNYAYPFHAGHYVLCQNGLLQVESCPAGSVYSLSTRRCSARQQLSSYDFLDYAYISGQLSTNFMQDLTTVTCPANAQGYYLHPFDCTKYLNCRDQQTSIESCERGEVFSISRRLCVARDQLVAPYDRVDYLTETQHEFYQGNQINHEGRELQTNEQTGYANGYINCPPGASGLRAHPYDCIKFLNCANGQTFIQSCEPGKAFNAANGVCDFIEQVDCSGRTKETLPPSNLLYNPNAISATAGSYRLVCPDQVYGLFAHPFDARSYIYCSEGHTTIRQCPGSEMFSLSRSYCLQGELVPVTDRVAFNYAVEHLESVVSCPRGAVGNYAYPFDCTQYLSCGEGLTRLQSCPNGLHFSLSLRRCQPVEQVQRSDRVYLLSELRIFYEWWQQMHRLGKSSTIICPYGLIGNFQHPTQPTKYINCAAQNAQAFIYSCPVGQVFSVSHRLCVPDSEVPEYDRCSYHQDSSSWIDLRYDNRESKAYVQPSHGPVDQFASGSGVKTTVTASGNRWSNMNMDRPAGIGFGQPQANGWSGHGSFYQQQAPAQSVLYVEGSLLPNHAGETARTEQTLNPTTYASRYDTTDFQRGTRRVDIIDSSTNANLNPNPQSNTNNWHSREFHRRHPNMPDPFEKPQHHYHHPHHQHHGPHHHQHSPSYHARHPNLPNPFNPTNEEPQPTPRTKFESEPNQDTDPDTEFEEGDFLPNPNAEVTTPPTSQIHLRSGFLDEPCEFDCGGGKCVKQSQVCDGVNNCGNRRDESQCEHLGYQVRLTGGESPHMGRIEVKVNGQWGYVCDDKFGLPDADVVCRELGYKMGASEVRGNSYYEPTERNFNYVMDKLECRGNETKLKDCDFMGWGVHNCAVDEVVGVVCKVPVLKCPNNSWLCQASKECIPPAFVCDNTVDCADKSDESDAVCKAPIEYRLEGGRSSLEGRLEVKYHGVWGSVCDDDFNVRAAQVACNSLGYYGEAKIEKNIFGPGSGPIWLDQVMCQGNETSIDLCRHWNWGEHNCNHTEDVSLRCTAGPPPRQARQRIRLQALSKDKSAGQASNISLSDIGLWERSSKALRTPRRCGIFKDDLFDEFLHPEQRVVQGNVARRGRHPWQATIRTRGRGGISSHWCGAVVISKRHLLTAAHCVYGHPKGAYFVRVGDHYANIAEHSEVDSFIETWYTHEQFRQPTHMNNDIALVVLKTPLKFNDYVQPICLPEPGAPLLENRTCTISGWGSIKSGVSTPSQELRAAQLPILADTTCKQMNVYGDAMTEGMFCAGSMDASVDACEGDSGGPLVCSDEDGETLYGIISWGQHCGYQNRPGVYVRVCHYVDWIYEKINQSLRRLK
ncbi:uncharacterized protein LOC6586608 isoform X5 [Drosophila mojavensis]|uniref:uncharacterized protein LOC6586608 isoform X5 n=1 Tax=Drosophila mojavensis TaxID=7230 RepID=UPI001CD15907|nr:uncharacterized protein LOC6586608 isoform X5 [Drosophila mojavensis]